MLFSCEKEEKFTSADLAPKDSKELMDNSLDQVAQLMGGLIRQGNTEKLPLEVEIIKDYKAPKNTAFELLDAYSNEELADAYKVWHGNSRSKSINEFKAMLGNSPTIDVEVPQVNANMDEWSLDKTTKIVVINDQYDDRKTKFLTAYDVETGKKVKLSTATPPDEYVVIIRESDYKIAKNKATGLSYHNNKLEFDEKKQLFETPNYVVYTIADRFIGSDHAINNLDNKDLGIRSTCTRSTRDKEDYVSYIGYKTEAALENWAETYSHIKTFVAFNEYLGGSWNARDVSKVWIIESKGNLYTCHTWIGCAGKTPKKFYLGGGSIPGEYIFNWREDEIATRVKYRWIEVDRADYSYSYTMKAPSGSVTIPVPGGVGIKINTGERSTTVNYDPQDDFMGEAIVEYCHNSVWPGREYSTGSFLFNVGD